MARDLLTGLTILALILSLFTVVAPALAHHEPPDGPEVTPTTEAFPGGSPTCTDPGATPVRIEGAKLAEGQETVVILSDGSTATITILSLAGDEFTFEVENGLAQVVKVKGGVATQDDVNVYDYGAFPGGGVPHDDGLTTPTGQGISHVDFCLVPAPEGSILIYKDDQTQTPVAGATFSVKNAADEEVGVIVTDAGGFGCLGGLPFGDYTVTETLAPDGWLPDPDTESVTVDEESTCEDRLTDPTVADADAVFSNILLGSLLVLKTDEEGAPLAGAEFTVGDAEGVQVNDTFTSDANGLFCVGDLVYGEEYTVTETSPPEGFAADAANPKTHVIDDTDDCATRLEATEPDPDLTFVNTQEDLGSITIVKEVVCEVCETFTPGRWFNQSPGTDGTPGTTFANQSLAADPITVAGITFASVADVHDNAKPGSLLRHYLALVMNVRWNAQEGIECDLLSLVYDGVDEDFVGMTVAEILAAAEAVLNAGGPEAKDEALHDVIDEINNADAGDGTITCEGQTNGAGAGFTFEIFTESDYNAVPQGEPLDTQTTGEDGTLTFTGLALDVTYVIVETDGPAGLDCQVTAVTGGDAILNADGSITVTLSKQTTDADLNLTLTVTNECVPTGGEQEEFDVTLIKEDQSGEPLEGISFDLSGDGYAASDTSDVDGIVFFDGLTAGTYTLAETTENNPCSNAGPWTVTVAADGTITIETTVEGQDDPIMNEDGSFTIINNCEQVVEEGSIVVTKCDVAVADCADPLMGATFELYLDDGDGEFDPEATNGGGGGGGGGGAASVTPVTNDATGAGALAGAAVADAATLTGASFVAVPSSGTPNGTAENLSVFATNGSTFSILTSGDVNLADDPNDSDGSGANLGGGNVRGDTDYDVTILKIDLTSPAGTNCLRFDFAFYSEEFPEYVNSTYNDAFIAELDASTWVTSGSTITADDNFAFDPAGDVISINSTGVANMTAENAAGTTYDGATVLLTAATPAVVGAHSLYLSLFDQGDNILDSAVFFDNIRFENVSDLATECVPGAQAAGGDTLIDTQTTGADGTATFAGLVPGTYWLRETEAPPNCSVIGEGVTKVEVTEATLDVTLEVDNECAAEAVAPGTSSPSPTVAEGVQGGVPNTAIDGSVRLGAATLALLLLGSLATVGYRNLAAVKRRRRR